MSGTLALEWKLLIVLDQEVYEEALCLAKGTGKLANSQLDALRTRASEPSELLEYLSRQKSRAWAEDRAHYPPFFDGVSRAIRRLGEQSRGLVGDPATAAVGRLPETPAGQAVHRILVHGFIEHLTSELQFRQAPRLGTPRSAGGPASPGGAHPGDRGPANSREPRRPVKHGS